MVANPRTDIAAENARLIAEARAGIELIGIDYLVPFPSTGPKWRPSRLPRLKYDRWGKWWFATHPGKLALWWGPYNYCSSARMEAWRQNAVF